ncbi:MAG: HNH endonuclease signature motif containing protein [Pseudotabrizicola sp.]|uniref:HNH endonuclease n=1 Tax=Pseudotabrizicola sp. TaxID=2939647 RepID=UPI00271CC2EC|nr:HNH endonuclease signature motif containing protein [Pseudotabrizicola sp.]MDO9637570.1 HNH endonuclease signature motif containing protein [Pseudotabrizicola sp.]
MKLEITQVSLSTSDLYYICQMVDQVTSDPFGWLRHIEDFAGDMSCSRLLNSFPKWTPLHEFIEFVVLSVAHEDAILTADDFLVSEGDPIEKARRGKIPWIDTLLASNGFQHSYRKYVSSGGEESFQDYLDEMGLAGPLDELLYGVSRQVFHVLFQNRKVLRNFGEMMVHYVASTGLSLYPDSYTERGALKRARPPVWARNAVFHRDKGCCVVCGTDLTKLINQRTQLHFDHIIPLVSGGMNDITNLQLLCSSCNLSKGGRNRNTSFRVDEWYSIEDEE